MPRPLFAYGTLRDPDVLGLVLGRAIDPAALRAATVPDHRVVFFPARTYPALRAAPGTRAIGTLIGGLAGTDLGLLDLFEGEEYVRRPFAVQTGNGVVEADVYWPVPEIGARAEDWRLVDWVSRHKAAFLAAEAGNLIELRRQLSALRR